MDIVATIIGACEVPGHRDWFSLGYGESRVTLRTQQVRALNLAWALNETKRLNGPVVIVGGGAAGLSVAAGLAHLGATVTVLERHPHTLPLQRNCYKRHLHPHIFNWPDESAQTTNAGLPLLNWNAGMANTVARSIEASFIDLVEKSNDRLRFCVGVSDLRIDMPQPRRVTFAHRGKTTSLEYETLIFALGFGVEDTFWSGPRGSYWADDSLEQLGVFPPGRYLVSGTGDGGLIDVLRIVLTNFRQDELARLVERSPDFEQRRDEISAIDEAARTAGKRVREDGTADRASVVEGTVLFDAYCAMQPLAGLEDKLRERIAAGVSVTLTSRSSSPFTLAARPLHRLLLSSLFFRFPEVLTFRQLDLQPGMLTHDGHRAVLDSGTREVFDHVVIRHGADDATRQFPALHRALSNKTPASALVSEKQFGTAFGATSALVAWSGEPNEERYAQACKDALTARAVDGGTIHVSSLRDVWMELRVSFEPRRTVEIDRVDDKPDADGAGAQEETEEARRRREKQEARRELESLSRERFRFRTGAFAVRPADYEPCGVTLLSGSMGTGKSTFVKQAVNHALVAYERDSKKLFPILVDRDPHLDDGDVVGAIADAAMQARELGAYSRAAWFVQRKLARGEAILFVDAFDTWSASSQDALAAWLLAAGAPALIAGRRFRSALTERLRRVHARAWELDGVPATAFAAFAHAHGCDAFADVQPTLRSSSARDWLTNPHLLVEALRLARAHALPPDTSPLSLYATAVKRELGAAPNNVAAFVRTSANALMRDPPQFYVSRDHVPREVRIHLATQTILTGGQSLEFSHLSLGEYLAASSLGDLAAERAALAGDSSWRTNLEILPLAHAMSSEALSAALADAQTRDPDHALLELLLRAVAYGGAEVTDFCRASADAVVTETARRLSLGNARFGDRERGLMRAFERAAGAFVGSRVPDGLPTLGEPGAEAWHLRMALEPTWNERPAESLWWSTIFHQARTLLSKSPAEVVGLTAGGSVFDRELALTSLGDAPERADLLSHRWSRLRLDELARCGEKPSARGLALIADDDARTRAHAIAIHHALWSTPVGQEILEELWRTETDAAPRTRALKYLVSAPEDAVLQLRALLGAAPDTVSHDDGMLMAALLDRLDDDERLTDDVERFLRGRGPWFLVTATDAVVRLYSKNATRRAILLDKLTGDVSQPEIRAAAVLGGDCVEALRAAAHRLSHDIKAAYRFADVLAALPFRDEPSRELRLAALDPQHLIGRGRDAEHRHSAVMCAAIKSFTDDPLAREVILGFFTHADESVVHAAVQAVGTHASADALLRFVHDGPHNAAIEAVRILARTDANIPALADECGARREVPPRRQHEREYVRAEIVKQIAARQSNAWLLDLVDDQHDAVRAVACAALVARGVADPRMRARAMTDNSHAVQQALWPTLAHDAEGRAFLLSRAAEDQHELRGAYFSLMSASNEGRAALLHFFRQRVKAGDGTHVRALIWPLARDPAARKDLVALATQAKNLDTIVTLMAAMPEDADLRKAMRDVLADTRKIYATFLYSSVADEFVTYFRHDAPAKQIALDRLQRGDLSVSNIDIPILANFAPARPTLLSLLQSEDLNAPRHARDALVDDHDVRARLLRDLASKDGHTRRDAVRALRDTAEAQTALAKLARDSDKEIRRVAYEALANVGRLDQECEALLRDESDPELRVAILDLLPRRELFASLAVQYAVTDRSSDVRTTAARDLQHTLGDHHVLTRDVLQVRALAGERTAIAAFLREPRDLREDREPHLFAVMSTWLVVKLLSTLPNTALPVAGAVDLIDTSCFGQVLTDADARHVRLRLASDAQQLARDRSIWPASNVALAWHVARNLIASRAASIVVACADIDSAFLSFPTPSAGQMLFGPTYFGFGLREGT